MSLSGAQVTQLWPYGGPGGRYGSFVKLGDPQKTYTETFTRHGVGGSPARPYGSFSGKSAGTPFALTVSSPVAISGTLLHSANLEMSFSWEFEPPLEIPQFTGSLGVSGNIQITAVFLNLVPSTLGITGALTTTGNLQWRQNLVTSPVSVAGAMAVTGNIQVVPGEPFNLVPSALPVAGALSATAPLQIGTSFNLVTFAMTISGGVTIFGNLDNIEFGEPFDLGSASTLLSGVMSIAGNIDAGTTYTHDSRCRIGKSGRPVGQRRIGKATTPVTRRRVGPRRL